MHCLQASSAGAAGKPSGRLPSSAAGIAATAADLSLAWLHFDRAA